MELLILEQHGFARNKIWRSDTDSPHFPTNSSNKTFVALILGPSEDDMKIWPHSYEFRLRVALGTSGADVDITHLKY
ncbi:putative glucose-6-phosphate 1-epimerase [Cinnamomum micranthum f. kanehirae]|uniref:Putative glucose-6-phosphate 1-epimerase n=1 Tax=Cinnamomum micranthum f. kanehirae TaxID=337451 RepID=A0A3S3MMF8_9MAGN|nr:putative glucose-6-phosphate 1-epimerase [Cinnamomum micranthum f. kanehirae]